eukprot:403372224
MVISSLMKHLFKIFKRTSQTQGFLGKIDKQQKNIVYQLIIKSQDLVALVDNKFGVYYNLLDCYYVILNKKGEVLQQSYQDKILFTPLMKFKTFQLLKINLKILTWLLFESPLSDQQQKIHSPRYPQTFMDRLCICSDSQLIEWQKRNDNT